MARNNVIEISSDNDSSNSSESEEINEGWEEVSETQSESDEVSSLNSDDSDYDEAMRTFVIKKFEYVLNNGKVTIPATFVRVYDLARFNEVEVHCPRTGYQLPCTLHKYADARRQETAISHVAIRGDFKWFKAVNNWREGDYIKFTKRDYEDRLVFDVETIG